MSMARATTTQLSLPGKPPSTIIATPSISERSRPRNSSRSSLLRAFQPSRTVLALTPGILPTPLPEAPWQIASSTSSNMPLRRLTSLQDFSFTSRSKPLGSI
jgi:hypothetical protein